MLSNVLVDSVPDLLVCDVVFIGNSEESPEASTAMILFCSSAVRVQDSHA